MIAQRQTEAHIQQASSRCPCSPLKYQRLLQGWSQRDEVNELYKLCAASGHPEVNVTVQHVYRWEGGYHKPRPIYRKASLPALWPQRCTTWLHRSSGGAGMNQPPAMNERRARVCAWAHRYLHQTKAWAVLDTETTGFTHRDEVIELALVDASGVVLFSSLIQTQNPQREELASHIHGITPQMLATAPTFPQIWPTVEMLFHQYQHLLVYNARFDRRLLEVTARRYGYRLPPVSWSCLMEQYALYHGTWNGSYTWQKLEVACARLGVQVDGNAHRAMTDALSTLGVQRALADRHIPQGEQA